MGEGRTGRRRTTALAALASLSMAGGLYAAGPGAAQAATGAGSSAAKAPQTYRGHGLGLRRSPGVTVTPAAGLRAFASIAAPAATLPASVDLSRYDQKVGDQGQVGSCAAWAIGYGMAGWFANREGHVGAPFAPMYAYSQVDGGQDDGSSPAAVLELLRTQGIDTAAHYALKHPQSSFDWSHLPSAAEHASAAANKITGWVMLYNTFLPPGSTAVTAIKQTLASGRPVAMAIGVYGRFLDASGHGVLVTSTGNLGRLLGFHEVLVVGYNSRGVVIENSWGTSWGDHGYATLDWGYVSQHSYEAETIAAMSTTTAPGRPVVTGLSATSGSRRGGQVVTVTGSGLASAIVSVGASSVPALSVTSDGRHMTFRIPPSFTIGNQTVRVSTPGGVSVGGPSTFRYTA